MLYAERMPPCSTASMTAAWAHLWSLPGYWALPAQTARPCPAAALPGRCLPARGGAVPPGTALYESVAAWAALLALGEDVRWLWGSLGGSGRSGSRLLDAVFSSRSGAEGASPELLTSTKLLLPRQLPWCKVGQLHCQCWPGCQTANFPRGEGVFWSLAPNSAP